MGYAADAAADAADTAADAAADAAAPTPLLATHGSQGQCFWMSCDLDS